MDRLFGREPAVTVGIVVALLIALLPVFNWNADVAATVAGAIAVLGGAVTAAMVSVDKLLPLLVGVGQAVVAVATAFSVNIPDNYITAGMAVLSVIAGLATRSQVSPKDPPSATLHTRPTVGQKTFDPQIRYGPE